MANPLPINERLSTAGQLVVRTRIFYDVWWLYDGADTRPTIIDAMRGYAEFFRFDPHAHFVSFIVHAAALFESREDTINLPLLVQEVGACDGVPSRTISECEALLSELRPYVPKIIILRSNLFAHRSASLSYEQAFDLAKITPIQLGATCDIALRIINRLLSAKGLQEQYFHTLPRKHLEEMLRALETAI
ncbi:MAG: hypothetical protein JWO68_4000 [Actinomycetia bacterium]|nr:hypothetical protein [Actinomycetes bacterium]